jgi:hypothetical protein
MLAGILTSGTFVKRHVLICGLIGGLLIAVLKWSEYRFLVIEHSIEIYGGLTAAIFAVLGIWLGLKLTGRQERMVVKEVSVAAGKPFIADESNREHLGITRGFARCGYFSWMATCDSSACQSFGGNTIGQKSGDGVANWNATSSPRPPGDGCVLTTLHSRATPVLEFVSENC